MTTRPVARARSAFFRAFYRLPGRWRRRLVRVATPKYIVGGVVLVRDAGAPEPGRMVLLRQPPGYGWSLPAGLLKRGEPPAVGAARELLEETGIRLSPADLTPAEPAAVVHHRGRWVDVVFEARVPAEVVFAVDGAEVLEAAWYRLDALPPLTPPTARLLAYYGIGPYVGYPEATDGTDE
jgi:ADP-ribose pyrophosphatase YjhB (NUDIX family)